MKRRSFLKTVFGGATSALAGLALGKSGESKSVIPRRGYPSPAIVSIPYSYLDEPWKVQPTTTTTIASTTTYSGTVYVYDLRGGVNKVWEAQG